MKRKAWRFNLWAAAVVMVVVAAVFTISQLTSAASAPYPHAPGDPTGDGRINAGDITQVELCILYPTAYPNSSYPGWDANDDGLGPNAGDILTVEYMIIGTWPLNQVYIKAPDELPYCTNFTATAYITRVEDFGSATYEVTYNAGVLEVVGVTNGSMVEKQPDGSADFYTINVTSWSLPYGEGMVRIISSAGGYGVTGGGYLSRIKFHVISSSPCDSSGIAFNETGCVLHDDGTPTPAEINATWVGDSLHVAPIPTPSPTISPTVSPTVSPTISPTVSPTVSPTPSPTASPTVSPTPTATPDDNVWIDAPGEVPAGGNFSVWVNVSVGTHHLAGATYDITYDPSVMNVTSVDTTGIVGGKAFPNSTIHSWSFQAPGEIRINQAMKALVWVSGSGYMARVYFHVNGSPCDDSDIEFNEAVLVKSDSYTLPANWISDSVHVGN